MSHNERPGKFGGEGLFQVRDQEMLCGEEITEDCVGICEATLCHKQGS